MRCAIGAVLLLIELAGTPTRADVTLPAIVSDHMVLQADMVAPIFGTAAEGEEITVEIAGQKKMTSASKEGKWLVKLDPVQSTVPLELKVTGKNSLVVKDILVGEVWLASGQSNMKYPLNRATDGATETANAKHPNIRYFSGKRWVECSPMAAGTFSAVAYYFAVDLQQVRRVPVGIIENAVSGAVGQAFMSAEGFDAELTELVKKHGEASSGIFNQSFVPIIPYGIRGAIWYQGEGNRDYPVTYRKLLTALIADWRKHWGQGDFPFLIVQLANYQEHKPIPWEGKDCSLREAQLKVSQTVPNTGLVVSIDCGIAKDVHYPNKKPVGQRLALAARGIAYRENIEFSGPIFASVKFEHGKAICTFAHIGSGLMAKEGEKLTGFLLCGVDKKWVRAEADIDGERVVVSSPMVPEPVAVRYAWERNPQCNLINKEGLPASPFRSDAFENFFTRDGSN